MKNLFSRLPGRGCEFGVAACRRPLRRWCPYAHDRGWKNPFRLSAQFMGYFRTGSSNRACKTSTAFGIGRPSDGHKGPGPVRAIPAMPSSAPMAGLTFATCCRKADRGTACSKKFSPAGIHYATTGRSVVHVRDHGVSVPRAASYHSNPDFCAPDTYDMPQGHHGRISSGTGRGRGDIRALQSACFRRPIERNSSLYDGVEQLNETVRPFTDDLIWVQRPAHPYLQGPENARRGPGLVKCDRTATLEWAPVSRTLRRKSISTSRTGKPKAGLIRTPIRVDGRLPQGGFSAIGYLAVGRGARGRPIAIETNLRQRSTLSFGRYRHRTDPFWDGGGVRHWALWVKGGWPDHLERLAFDLTPHDHLCRASTERAIFARVSFGRRGHVAWSKARFIVARPLT